MPRTSAFISTVAAVFSQMHLAVPTPVPVSTSSTSLPDSAVRPTTSQSSTGSEKSTSTTSSRRLKNFAKKLKLHNDVWWTSTPETTAMYQDRPQVVLHEWSYMYL